jgi:hypothetical protein
MKCKYCGKETDGSFCSQEHEENSAVFNILENITDELDIVYKATSYPWKVKLTSKSYDTLKNRPGTHWVPEAKEYQPRNLVYEKGGHEWLVCWENHNIPFIIHARISDKDADLDDLKLDDLDEPNIEENYRADFAAFQASL